MSKNYNQTLQTNNSSLEDIIEQLNNMPDAGGSADPVLQDKTVTPTTSKQTITADSGYDGLDTVTVNAMPTATQATPSITVNTSGLITATATQTAGYVAAGTKSATQQLTTQAAQTITPGTTDKTIASGRYLTGTQTIKGDSNLIAANIVSGKTIFGVAGTATAGGGSGGGTENEDKIIDRTIVSYTNDRVTRVGNHAFYYCRTLATVSFPACTTISSYAFGNCSNLTTVSFPACTTICSSAFYYCSKLTTVSFPACTTISGYAFGNCGNLTTVSFPACRMISDNAFRNCSKLTTVSFPACTTMFEFAFYYCSNLTTIRLMASSVCKLSNSNAFSNTGIWSDRGSIIVPASLVTAYKAATNWTFFSNRIFGA